MGVYLKYAHKSAEQRSRGEYKPVNVLIYGFRLIDLDDGKRHNPYKYRAWNAHFMKRNGSIGSRWYYGGKGLPKFLSRFLGGGTTYRPPRRANFKP